MILRNFNCFSATSVRQLSVVIVVEGVPKQLRNKGISVAFQITTWKGEETRKHLLRETNGVKYAFFCLNLKDRFLKFRLAKTTHLNVLFASNVFSSSTDTLYVKSLS